MELKNFNQVFEKLVENIDKVPFPTLVCKSAHKNLETDIASPVAIKWIRDYLRCNIPRYSQFRGICVPVTYKATVENPTKQDLELSNILGWVYQIYQHFNYMGEHFWDQREERFRQKICPTNDQVVSTFLNDLALMEHLAFKILRYYFGHLGETYNKMLDLLLNSSFVTFIGQHVETFHSWQKTPEKFSYELYFQKLKLKTCYCTYNLPFKLALLFAGISEEKDNEIWNLVDELTFDLGYLIQIQNDFVDSAHDMNSYAIKNGTCNWIFLKAKDLCNAEQWEILKNNYGWDDQKKIATVKELYNKLNLKKYFKEEQEMRSDSLKEKVSRLPSKAKGLGVGILYVLNALCKDTEGDVWH